VKLRGAFAKALRSPLRGTASRRAGPAGTPPLTPRRPHPGSARGRTLSAAALLAALLWAPAPAAAEALPVAASIHPLALLVAEVGGDAVAVQTLLPPGASPHGFEPTPSQVRALASARLLVTVGAGLDDWADRMYAAVGGKARVAVAAHGPLMPAGPGHHHHDGDDDHDQDADHDDHTEHEHGPNDPHVWLDPVWVRDHAVPALEKALAAAAPEHAAAFHANAADFAGRLTALDTHLAAELVPARGKAFVAFHGSWTYFAARYGLKQVAVVEPLPGREPTARWMAEVIGEARASGARVVLIEPQFAPGPARTIAAQFDGRVVTVDPVGDPRTPQGASYEALMRFNARAFREGLAS
jgi:ABC-type Zn uptake system ZnuABC Zn-binding protein ZnuA